MKHLKLFENYLLEYHSADWGNVWNVADSKKPIEGPAVLIDAGKSFEEATKKIDKAYDSFQDHYKKSMERIKNSMEAAKKETFKDGKPRYQEESLIKREKELKRPLELAMKILKESKEFMHKHNDLYNKYKDDLTGTDHVKVAKAITKFIDIYPKWTIMQDMGTLKRITYVHKDDQEFIDTAIKWPEEIQKSYQQLKEAGKNLGKTEKQIAGRAKSSAAMKMRWGGF